MKDLQLKNVTKCLRIGKTIHILGLICCFLVGMGHLFNLQFLTQPYISETTIFTSVVCTAVLIILYNDKPYAVSRYNSLFASAVLMFLISSFFVDYSYFESSIFTKIILSLLCIVVLKSCKRNCLRLLLIFLIAFLPFNSIVSHILNIEYVTENISLTTTIITTFAAWGLLFKQAYLRCVRYFIADTELLKLTAILVGVLFLVSQLGILFVVYIQSNAHSIELYVSAVIIEWVVLGSILITMNRVSKIANDNRKLFKQSKILSITDSLTGATNRNGMSEHIQNINNESVRIIGVIYFDIDHFKKVNDTYGHDVGDQILKEIVQVAKSHLRSGDLLVRLGGEEFCIIMTHANDTVVYSKALSLHIAFKSYSNSIAGNITCSFGTTSGALHVFEKILKRADEALYYSKRNGRDRVTAYSHIGLK